MVIKLKLLGLTINQLVMLKSSIKMVMNIKEIILMGKKKVMVFLNLMKINFIKENSKMIK